MPPRSRLFRWVMLLYPPAYRERWRVEMESFHRQERANGAGGPRFWLRFTVDHLRAAGAVRGREGRTMMRQIVDDVRQGARGLVRAPAFTVFAVLTLALGVGATTAVFSVLDRVVLRPLPYPESERMVLVGTEPVNDPGVRAPMSRGLLVALREAPGPAEAVVGAGAGSGVLRTFGDPERLRWTRVSPGFFDFLGARAGAGRLLDAGDHAAGAAPVAVLEHAFWAEHFAGDPTVVGRTIRLDDEVVTVVGVLPESFVPPPELAGAGTLYTPLGLADGTAGHNAYFLAVAARLQPGVDAAGYLRHVDGVLANAYGPDGPPNFLAGAVVRDYRSEIVGDVSGTLGRVLGAVALLLLIACVNVASLLLTRGTERRREMQVRAALGAGRARLVRQLLAESGGLAVAGGVLGAGLAWGAVEAFRRYAPDGLPRLAEVAVDGRGLAFSLALAIATVVLFGLLPALRATRGAGSDVAGGSWRGATAGRREARLRGGLVAVETALAVVLAVGSALLARDLVRMATLDPGFRAEGLVSLNLDLRPRYERAEWGATWERLLEGAGELPGVTSASLATQIPYTGDRIASVYRPETSDGTVGDDAFVITLSVAGDYPATLGGRMVEGRALTPRDGTGTPGVLVNEAFVRRYWPDGRAVGRTIRSGGAGIEDEPVYTVVGVVADMVTRPGRDVVPRVHLPLSMQAWSNMEVVVRTEGDPEVTAEALRALVRRLDPALPVTGVRTVTSLGREALARPRFYTVLFGGFAAVALLLAVVGVYGTTAYATRSSTREIGIRMALGALRGRVVGRVVARTSLVVGLGVLVGLAGAGYAARFLRDSLHHVGPRDAPTYVVVATLVLAAGVLAAWIPAGRAGRVDPARTLRDEG